MPETTHRRNPQPDHRTLDQQRAAYAWTVAARVRNARDLDFRGFTNLAKSAPALIMGNGLMATLAFFEQKSREAQALNAAICGWLSQRMEALFVGSGYQEIMEGLHGAGSAQYLHATEEALEILRWIRQFAPTLEG